MKGPLYLEQPLEIDEARLAARRLADQRRQAEKDIEEQVKLAAEMEREYRKAYAKAFVTAIGTAGEREAIAKRESAPQAYDRDIQAGMVKVLQEKLRGLEGERSMLKTLMEWSMKADATPGAMGPQPQWTGDSR